jgi:hypothetical protein
MDMREQVRQQAEQVLRQVTPEEAWDVETGIEEGWAFARTNATATVEQVVEQADASAKARWQGNTFKQAFISAALGGVENIIF